MTKPTVEFEPYPLKQRMFAHVDANNYCVWATSGQTKEIKADTAYEAFRKSGFSGIIKIERVSNLSKTLFEKSAIIESESVPDTAMSENSIQERIRRRKNPILLPDEMDELMRAFLTQHAPLQETEEMPRPDTNISRAQHSTPLRASVPPPAALSAEPETYDPVGMDVHGDGFDEIIPAAHPAKPLTPKAEAAKEASRPTNAAELSSDTLPPVMPERELSAEEVEKLLSEEKTKSP